MPAAARLAIGAVAAAVLLGNVSGPRLPIATTLLAIAAAVAAMLAPFVGLARGRQALAPACGVAILALRLALDPPGAMNPPPLPPGGGPWTATVETIGSLNDGSRPAILRLSGDAVVAASLPAWPAVVPGDEVEVAGEVEPRPDGDYGEYLARIGASGTLRVSQLDVRPPTGDVGRALEGLRRAADEAIAVAVPEPEAGLASGILIGLRDRVDRALAADFTTAGASHVVAISGWNIAIVAATLAALAGRVARRRRAVLTAAAILVYVLFVGASPSVVRAAAMAGVVLLARELGRPSTAAAAIGWAVVGLLLADPRLVDDVGFRLSAAATAGLIAWATPLTRRLAGPATGRARGWLAESLGVSLAAQAATLPIVAMEFGRLSLVSPVVNLGVVPLVAPAMAAGVAALVAGLVGPASGLPIVATLGGLPAWTLLSGIVAIVHLGAAVPLASLDLAPPWDAAVGAVTAGLVLAVGWRRGPRRRGSPGDGRPVVGADTRPRTGPGTPAGLPPSVPTPRVGAGPPPRRGPALRLVTLGLAISVVGLAVALAHRPDGAAHVTVLDVGQGDAIVVEGSLGSRLLVDGGPDPGRLLVALDEHLPPWDRRIDVVILTHPHEDHAAGLAALIGRYGVRRVYEPGTYGPGPGYAALEAVLAEGGTARGVLSTGDRLAIDDVAFTVLWPDPDAVPERAANGGTAINNVSIVLLGEVNGHRFLLTGDIEEAIDPILVARGLPTVEVLKVAHHGSRTASTEPFIEAVRPALAIISSGRGNPYGHPAPSTIDRLTGDGARVLRTDTDGTVSLDLGPGPIRTHVARLAGSTGRAPSQVGSGAPSSPAPADALRAAVVAALGCGIASTRTATSSVFPPSGAAAAPAVTSAAVTVPAPPIVRTPRADRPEWLRYHARRDPSTPDAPDRPWLEPARRDPARWALVRRRPRPASPSP